MGPRRGGQKSRSGEGETMISTMTVENLSAKWGDKTVLEQVSFEVCAGSCVAVVGDSGSGKSTLLRAILGLMQGRGGSASGLLTHSNEAGEHKSDLSMPKSDAKWDILRGDTLSLLPQEARASLDPLRPVKAQLALANASSFSDRHLRMLKSVGFNRPEKVLHLYPHQLSGGMARRVAIAQALIRGSQFLLADEPTANLDPVSTASIMALLQKVKRNGVGLTLISHDLSLVQSLADVVLVLENGKIVETAKNEAGTSLTLVSAKGIEMMKSSGMRIGEPQ